MAWNRSTFINPPAIHELIAWVMFIVNIVAPGIGTMIVGFLSCNIESFIMGVLQLVTAPFIVGWVWSILWGWELVKVSRTRGLGVL